LGTIGREDKGDGARVQEVYLVIADVVVGGRQVGTRSVNKARPSLSDF